MKIKIKKLLMALAFSMLSAIASAQEARVGINTTTPKTTLDVSGKLNTAGTAIDPTDMTGLQAPRLTRAELTNKGDIYGADQKGALIYITDITGGNITTQRINIDAVGYYYFDGSVWQKVSADANEPWYNVATNTGATANTQDIYQTGKVGIGTSTPTAPLHVTSATAGAIRIADGTQGEGKVLTSDANGVGTWKANAGWSATFKATSHFSSTAGSEAQISFPVMTLPYKGRYLCIYGSNLTLENAPLSDFEYAYFLRAKVNGVVSYEKVYNQLFPSTPNVGARKSFSQDYSFLVTSSAINQVLSLFLEDGASSAETIGTNPTSPLYYQRNAITIIYLGE